MLKTSSITEQVYEHLYRGLARGRWTGQMPGRYKLAAELGVNPKTVESALKQLTENGHLADVGPGKRRRIVAKQRPLRALRIRILVYEVYEAYSDHISELRHQLELSGHLCDIAPKSLNQLNQDANKVAKMVEATPADAWIVHAGSRAVIEWFASSSIPALALFGRRHNVKIASAGADKTLAIRDATNRLIDLGHRGIVFIAHEERRIPVPSYMEIEFMKVLKSRGITPGKYNLPDWTNSPKGLHECLDSLFKITPPTALILDSGHLFHAVDRYLVSKHYAGLEGLSIICTQFERSFSWCNPAVSHITFDAHRVVSRVVSWANKLSQGINQRRHHSVSAKFIEGGTIGPAPKGSGLVCADLASAKS